MGNGILYYLSGLIFAGMSHHQAMQTGRMAGAATVNVGSLAIPFAGEAVAPVDAARGASALADAANGLDTLNAATDGARAASTADKAASVGTGAQANGGLLGVLSPTCACSGLEGQTLGAPPNGGATVTEVGTGSTTSGATGAAGATSADGAAVTGNQILNSELAGTAQADGTAATDVGGQTGDASGNSSPQASSPKPSADNPNFASEQALQNYFDKHVTQQGEFGNITIEQYISDARKLVTSKPGGDIITYTRSHGDTLFYNTANNEFAVVTNKGLIRTFFP